MAAACTGGDGGASPQTTVAPTLPPTTSTTARSRLPGPLRVGVIVPRTGDAAAFGPPLLAGIQLAGQDINAAGGVNGEKIEVVEPRDEAKEPDAALELIRDGAVDAIIGPASSPDALAVAETVNQARIVTCSPTAGSIALTKFGNQYIFRTMPSDALEGAALAKVLSQSGLGSAAVVYPDDGYGQEIFKQLRDHLESSVVKLPFSAAYDPNGTQGSFDAIAGQLVAADPRMVVVIGLPESGGRMLSAVRDAPGASRVNRWYVSAAMREPNLFEKVAPGRADGLQDVLGVAPVADPQLASFTSALKAVSRDASAAYAAYAYDCLNLIALAAQVAKSNDPKDFRDHMVEVSRAGVTCTTFASCAGNAAQKPPLNFDYEGVSGPVDLEENGDVSAARYELFGFDTSGRDVAKNVTFTAPP